MNRQQHAEYLTNRLIADAPSRPFAFEPFPQPVGLRNYIDPRSFAVLSSVGEVARHRDEIITTFGRAFVEDSEAKRSLLSLSPFINRYLLLSHHAIDLGDQPAIVYSSRFGSTLKAKVTSEFTFQDSYRYSGIAQGPHQWLGRSLDLPMANVLAQTLRWKVPRDSRADAGLVLLQRIRHIFFGNEPNWRFKEITEILGFADLSTPWHVACLHQGYLPAQEGAFLDGPHEKTRIIAQPSVTIACGVLACNGDYTDTAADVLTISVDHLTGEVVGIFCVRGMAAMRLHYASGAREAIATILKA